jgi:hypothetical protein
MKNILFLFLFPCLCLYGFAQETTVNLQTNTGKVEGTLSIPSNVSHCPVVLIIAGSGPTDRNGNNNMGLKTDAYKQLADTLRQHGIASLRYDKRGIAASQSLLFKESDVRFDTYIQDAKAWIDQLETDKRFSKIIVAGHSEGSLIGMAACENNLKVAAFISISGAGRPADELLKEQLQTLPQEIKNYIFGVIDKLKKGETETNVPVQYNSLFRASVQPYLISWFKYDPQIVIAKLNIPILIVQGSTDIQVSVKDAELLAKAQPKAQLVIIPGMNHALKNCATTAQTEQMVTYGNADLPLNKEFATTVIHFIINGIKTKEENK